VAKIDMSRTHVKYFVKRDEPLAMVRSLSSECKKAQRWSWALSYKFIVEPYFWLILIASALSIVLI